jgi:hypothetical protein
VLQQLKLTKTKIIKKIKIFETKKRICPNGHGNDDEQYDKSYNQQTF